MDDILASIRRIIADDQSRHAGPPARRSGQGLPPAAPPVAEQRPPRSGRLNGDAFAPHLNPPPPQPGEPDFDRSVLSAIAQAGASAALKRGAEPVPADPLPVDAAPEEGAPAIASGQAQAPARQALFADEAVGQAPARAEAGPQSFTPAEPLPGAAEAAPLPPSAVLAPVAPPPVSPASGPTAPEPVPSAPAPAPFSPSLTAEAPPMTPPTDVPAAVSPDAAPRGEPEALLSPAAGASVETAFNALATSVFLQNTGAIEATIRDMLKPMLRTWLDDNLPVIVERLVRAEIERVARGGRP